MNSFGTNFRLSIWGESHGPKVGVTIDGLVAGIALSQVDFEADLARRRAGATGTTARHEADIAHIVSGLYNGLTTGAPLTIEFTNDDTRPQDYAATAGHFRPSHADFAAHHKYNGMNDPRGGGHFSARLTVALVAAGVVAKKVLGAGVVFATRLVEVGGVQLPARLVAVGGEACPTHLTKSVDVQDTAHFEAVLQGAVATQDSVGGLVECRVQGLPIGVGDPFFDSVESVVAHLLFAIPAVKGVEFGAGFAAVGMRGSEHNDLLTDATGKTATNHAGGITGGLANGNELVVRAAFKPTSSIGREQPTYNSATDRVEPLRITGRHDACVALRGAVVVEAAVAIALADLMGR